MTEGFLIAIRELEKQHVMKDATIREYEKQLAAAEATIERLEDVIVEAERLVSTQDYPVSLATEVEAILARKLDAERNR